MKIRFEIDVPQYVIESGEDVARAMLMYEIPRLRSKPDRTDGKLIDPAGKIVGTYAIIPDGGK